MSKGLRPQTITGRVRACLPATYEAVYAAIPDVPRDRVFHCIRALRGHGHVEVSADGVISLAEMVAPRTILHRVTGGPGPERGEERITEPVKATLWSASPEQSPRVTCPARVTVGLSTCLDDYTAAASGHRSGPVECAKCPVGRRRRMELA